MFNYILFFRNFVKVNFQIYEKDFNKIQYSI